MSKVKYTELSKDEQAELVRAELVTWEREHLRCIARGEEESAAAQDYEHRINNCRELLEDLEDNKSKTTKKSAKQNQDTVADKAGLSDTHKSQGDDT